MAIDVDSEDLIHFPTAGCEFPGRRKLALATLHRWRLHGVRGVKLETCLVGGLRYTSREAIRRFIASQNAEPASTPPAITPKQCARQSANAREVLKAEFGI